MKDLVTGSGYDELRNRTRQVDAKAANGNDGTRSIFFEYDRLGRSTRKICPASTGGNCTETHVEALDTKGSATLPHHTAGQETLDAMMKQLPLAIILFVLRCHGCVATADYGRIAINFVTFLVIRDYSSAYALTSTVYRQRYSMGDLRVEFERTFPRADGSFDPVSVQAGVSDWPSKPSPDLT